LVLSKKAQPDSYIRRTSELIYFFAETFWSFFAETFWSLKHFGYLFHSYIKTHHNSIF